MNITDLSKGNDRAAFTARTDLWGDDALIEIILDAETPRGSHTIERIYPVLEKLLILLDMKRIKIEDTLLDNGWLETAEEWAAQGKPSKREQGCYIMEDGSKAVLPLTEDDFCGSLHLESVSVYFDEELDINDVTLYFVCSPDYFAGRAIAVLLDNDGGIEVKGLED